MAELQNSHSQEDYVENKEVSRRISQHLEIKGYCKQKLEIKSAEVKIRECMERDGGKVEIFSTGSHTEGVDISGSDRDTMLIIPGIHVINDLSQLPRVPTSSHVCMMDQEDTRPCYTRLYLIHKAVPEDPWFRRIGSIEDVCNEMNGKQYLSSKLFAAKVTESVSSGLPSSESHTMANFHVHGPCATFDNKIGSQEFDTDFAFCLPCVSLPAQCLPWFTRTRGHGWPSLDFLARAKEENCHMVAIGNKASPTADLEWRISYTPIERELVWSLNDIQCKCYVILKMILKQMIDPLVPDLLSSFNIKTCMFWMAETTDPTMWTEDNLIVCVQLCLQQLARYVKKATIPHYIVPENNLLIGKFQSTEDQAVAYQILIDLSRKDWTFLLECKALSKLKRIWHHVSNDLNSFLTMSRIGDLQHMFSQDMLTFRAIQTLYTDVNIFSDNVSDYRHKLRRAYLLKDVNAAMVGFLRKVVQERIDFMSDTLPVSLENSATSNTADVCTERLLLATTLYTHARYREAEQVLCEILRKYDVHVMYLGVCGPDENDIFAMDYLCHLGTSGTVSMEQRVSTYVALDVSIQMYDKVPYALQFEQMLWDEDDVSIYIHPIVYLHFLHFLVFTAREQRTDAQGCLIALDATVQDTTSEPHVFADKAWNMLGFCHWVAGNGEEAIKAFSKSLQFKRNNNAAAYHLAIMVLQTLRSQNCV